MDNAMLKVNNTSSRNGGTGSIIMPSITNNNSGTPRLPRPTPVKLLRILRSCVRSNGTPGDTAPILDAECVRAGVQQEGVQLLAAPKPAALAWQASQSGSAERSGSPALRLEPGDAPPPISAQGLRYE